MTPSSCGVIFLYGSKTKNPLRNKGFRCFDYGAVERTRTSTGVRPLPPQDSVSAIPPLPHIYELLPLRQPHLLHYNMKQNGEP